MKTFLKFAILAIFAIACVVIFKTISVNSIQPSPLDDDIPSVRETASQNLSNAIKYQTISHKIGMMDETAFDGFLQFIDSTYIEFSSVATKEIFSSHTLLYKWEGSQPDLKPFLLMAHMDVVPVENSSLEKWDHPPFEGEIADGFINGRGSLDDKGSLIAILEAAENLASKGFKPKHTLYFLFGQDEEIGGHEGAELVVKKFIDEDVTLGLVWDEGTVIGKNLVPGLENEVALIGIAEKGYASFELSVEIQGGHSSIPEQENSIGELADAISTLRTNPFPYEISPPVQGFIDYLGPEMPFVNKMAFSNTWLFKPLIFKSYAETGSGRALIQTTIAPTIFQSGFKDNVIPVNAKAVINCRILPGHTVESTVNYLKEVIDNDKITITPMETQVNPSRSSDYNSDKFKTLGAVVRTVYPNSYAAPFLMLGATDSRHFEPVCENIFKFAPFVYQSEDLKRLHGINERISTENFSNAIRIYQMAIVNLDKL